MLTNIFVLVCTRLSTRERQFLSAIMCETLTRWRLHSKFRLHSVSVKQDEQLQLHELAYRQSIAQPERGPPQRSSSCPETIEWTHQGLLALMQTRGPPKHLKHWTKTRQWSCVKCKDFRGRRWRTLKKCKPR